MRKKRIADETPAPIVEWNTTDARGPDGELNASVSKEVKTHTLPLARTLHILKYSLDFLIRRLNWVTFSLSSIYILHV